MKLVEALWVSGVGTWSTVVDAVDDHGWWSGIILGAGTKSWGCPSALTSVSSSFLEMLGSCLYIVLFYKGKKNC